MVNVAQLVRALDCGSKGRGFESHLSPFLGRCVVMCDAPSFLFITHTSVHFGSVDFLGCVFYLLML